MTASCYRRVVKLSPVVLCLALVPTLVACTTSHVSVAPSWIRDGMVGP
jgi:hypothetical protein